MGRPLYVHVGSRKTGTSALQIAVWTSAERLATAGVASPLLGREPHVRRILHPLGWTHPDGYVGAVDRPALAWLTRRLRRSPGERLLLTNEDLAEAEPAQIAAFVETAEAADLDLHVIVTARDWAQQLPSEWQQELKDRSTIEYEAFLTHVRHRETPAGERFWRRQDVLDICERWGAGLEPERVHVLVVPPASVDRRAVFRLFAGVVGFDPALLKAPSGRPNASFGYREAEMLRRLNLVLGDRLPDFNDEYLPAIRRVLVRRVIARGASARVPLPPHHVDWVRATAEAQLGGIVERGYQVHGDPNLLVPAADVGRPVPTVDGDELADAALQTLASFAVVQFEASRNGALGSSQNAGTAAGRSTRDRLREALPSLPETLRRRFGIRSDTAPTR